MTTLSYGDIKIDPATIPEVSRTALMQFGLSHFLGNVQASKLVARITGENKPQGVTKFKMVTDDITAWRVANAEKVEAWKAEHLAEALRELNEGTIGAGSGGPRLDPVDRAFREIVIRDVTATLKGAGLKMPKSDDEVITFGEGVTRTRAQMLQNVSNGPKREALMKQAHDKVAEEARRAKRATDDAAKKAAAGPVTAEALGL